MNPQFNLQRIGRFIYRDLVLLKGSITTAASVIAVLFFIGSLFDLRGDLRFSAEEFVGMLRPVYIIAGILFTFAILREAHYKKGNHFYFSLPISPLERILAIWCASSLLFTVVFTLFGMAVGQVAIAVASFFSSVDFHLVHPFTDSYWSLIKFYTLIQPAFLLGAISFRKNRIGKTLFLVILTVTAVFLFNVILCFLFSDGSFDLFESDPFTTQAFAQASDEYSSLGSFLFGFVLGPLMLLACYYKLIEKEV